MLPHSIIVIFKGCAYVSTCNAVQILCPKRSKRLSTIDYCCCLFVGSSEQDNPKVPVQGAEIIVWEGMTDYTVL